MKFKLECNRYDTATITYEFSEETLPEILTEIEIFLRGCGFFITNIDYDVPSS